MTAETVEDASPLAGAYAERLVAPNPALPLGTPRGRDEFVAHGQVRPSAALLEEALTRFGTIGLQARRRTVVAEISARAEGTFLAGMEPVVTDARSGRGLDELVERRRTLHRGKNRV